VVKVYRLVGLGQLLSYEHLQNTNLQMQKVQDRERKAFSEMFRCIERDAGTQKLEDRRARHGVWRTGSWGGEGLVWAAVPAEGRKECTVRVLKTNMQEHTIINDISGFRRGLRPSLLWEFTLNLRSVTS